MIEREPEPKKHLEYIPGQLIIQVEEPAVRPHLAAATISMTARTAQLLPDAVT